MLFRSPGSHLSDVLPDVWPQIRDSLKHVLDTHTPALNREIGRRAAGAEPERDWLFSFFPVLVGSAVIGIGINANLTAAELPPTDRLPATSLLVEGGVEVDRVALLESIAVGLDDALAAFDHTGFAPFASRFAQLDADRKSTRLNSSHSQQSRMPSSA